MGSSKSFLRPILEPISSLDSHILLLQINTHYTPHMQPPYHSFHTISRSSHSLTLLYFSFSHTLPLSLSSTSSHCPTLSHSPFPLLPSSPVYICPPSYSPSAHLNPTHILSPSLPSHPLSLSLSFIPSLSLLPSLPPSPFSFRQIHALPPHTHRSHSPPPSLKLTHPYIPSLPIQLTFSLSFPHCWL